MVEWKESRAYPPPGVEAGEEVSSPADSWAAHLDPWRPSGPCHAATMGNPFGSTVTAGGAQWFYLLK